MESYSALYYPFIHFKSDQWLKLAALYWDDVSRIVPDRYTPEDSATVVELGSFVKTVRPGWVSPAFSEAFIDFIAAHAPRLRERFGVDRVAAWDEVPVAARPPAAGGSSGSDPRLGYVFFEKLTPELHTSLLDSGLARTDPNDPFWIGMHPLLCAVYTTALADALAGEHGLRPITDNTADHLAIGGLTVERLADLLLGQESQPQSPRGSRRELESLAAFIAIDAALPKDIEHIPVKKILEFRDKHLEGRGAFQAYLSGFLDQHEWLARIGDPAALPARLTSELDKNLTPKLTALRNKLGNVGIDTVTSVLTVQISTPLLLGQAAAAAGLAINPIAAVAAGGALAFAKVLRDREKAKGDVRASPVSYLLETGRELAPRTVLERVTEYARRVFSTSSG